MLLFCSCINYQMHTYYFYPYKIYQHSTCLPIKNTHHHTLQFMMGLKNFLKLHKRNITLKQFLIKQNIQKSNFNFLLDYLKVHMFCNRMSNKSLLLYNLYCINLHNHSSLWIHFDYYNINLDRKSNFFNLK
jgi:hypothetical protein